MKTLRRGISYNLACSIMKANNWAPFITEIKSVLTGDSFIYAFKNKEQNNRTLY